MMSKDTEARKIVRLVVQDEGETPDTETAKGGARARVHVCLHVQSQHFSLNKRELGLALAVKSL